MRPMRPGARAGKKNRNDRDSFGRASNLGSKKASYCRLTTKWGWLRDGILLPSPVPSLFPFSLSFSSSSWEDSRAAGGRVSETRQRDNQESEGERRDSLTGTGTRADNKRACWLVGPPSKSEKTCPQSLAPLPLRPSMDPWMRCSADGSILQGIGGTLVREEGAFTALLRST